MTSRSRSGAGSAARLGTTASATIISENNQRVMASPLDSITGVAVDVREPPTQASGFDSPPGAVVVAFAAFVAAGGVAADAGGLGGAGDRQTEAVVVQA